MRDNGVARALATLLLGGLVALFVALALDMAVPAPADPYASTAAGQVSAAKQAEFDKRRTDIEARLSAKQISQALADQELNGVDVAESAASQTPSLSATRQADFDAQRAAIELKLSAKEITEAEAIDQLSSVDDAESSAADVASTGTTGDDAAFTQYDQAVKRRALIVGIVAAFFAAGLLALGVVLTRRSFALGPIPLFAGAFLAIWATGTFTGAEAGWVRVLGAGLMAGAATTAGLLAYGRRAADAAEPPA